MMQTRTLNFTRDKNRYQTTSQPTKSASTQKTRQPIDLNMQTLLRMSKPQPLRYKNPYANDKSFGITLQNLAAKRNAMQRQKYAQTLSNIYDQAQNRKQRASQFTQSLQFQRSNAAANRAQSDRHFQMSYGLDKQKNDIAILKAMTPKREQETDPLVLQKRRAELFDTLYPSKYGEDERDYLSDNETLLNSVRAHYVETGSFPTLKPYKGDSWFGNDYEIDTRAHQYGKNTQQGFNGVNQGMNGYNNTPDINKTPSIVDEVAVGDDKRYVKMSDGNWYYR